MEGYIKMPGVIKTGLQAKEGIICMHSGSLLPFFMHKNAGGSNVFGNFWESHSVALQAPQNDSFFDSGMHLCCYSRSGRVLFADYSDRT